MTEQEERGKIKGNVIDIITEETKGTYSLRNSTYLAVADYILHERQEAYLLGVENGVKECQPEIKEAKKEGAREALEKAKLRLEEELNFTGDGYGIMVRTLNEIVSENQPGGE